MLTVSKDGGRVMVETDGGVYTVHTWVGADFTKHTTFCLLDSKDRPKKRGTIHHSIATTEQDMLDMLVFAETEFWRELPPGLTAAERASRGWELDAAEWRRARDDG